MPNKGVWKLNLKFFKAIQKHRTIVRVRSMHDYYKIRKKESKSKTCLSLAQRFDLCSKDLRSSSNMDQTSE